jgi:alpha-glucosidase
VLGNHDRPRIATRVGAAQARVAAMLLLTLRGTPTIYYGDELGMRNVAIAPDAVQDPFERRVPGLGLGRDPVRTPMQWSAAPQAGFTSGRPWLPVASDYAAVNVAAEQQDSKSMLALYTRLIALRRAEPALRIGSLAIRTKSDASAEVLTYLRGDTFLVALNLGGQPRRVQLPRGGTSVLSTHLDRVEERIGETLELRPDEGLVVRLAH